LPNFPGESVVFVRGDEHLFVGVRATPRRGDHYVRVQGIPYILLELTTPWPVGRVSEKQWTRTRGCLLDQAGPGIWPERALKVTGRLPITLLVFSGLPRVDGGQPTASRHNVYPSVWEGGDGQEPAPGGRFRRLAGSLTDLPVEA
jgi:hypothetical protein